MNWDKLNELTESVTTEDGTTYIYKKGTRELLTYRDKYGNVYDKNGNKVGTL